VNKVVYFANIIVQKCNLKLHRIQLYNLNEIANYSITVICKLNYGISLL